MSIFRRKNTSGKRKKRKKGKKKIPRWFRAAGFLVTDPKAKKRALHNRPARYPWELFFLDEPARFDQQVGRYSTHEAGRVVKVHVIPAPWRRVFLYSLLYAFVIGVTKFCVFYTFGKPRWIMAKPPTAIEAELAPDDAG